MKGIGASKTNQVQNTNTEETKETNQTGEFDGRSVEETESATGFDQTTAMSLENPTNPPNEPVSYQAQASTTPEASTAPEASKPPIAPKPTPPPVPPKPMSTKEAPKLNKFGTELVLPRSSDTPNLPTTTTTVKRPAQAYTPSASLNRLGGELDIAPLSTSPNLPTITTSVSRPAQAPTSLPSVNKFGGFFAGLKTAESDSTNALAMLARPKPAVTAEPIAETEVQEDVTTEPIVEAEVQEEVATEPAVTAEPIAEAVLQEEITAEPITEAVVQEEVTAEPMAEPVVQEEVLEAKVELPKVEIEEVADKVEDFELKETEDGNVPASTEVSTSGINTSDTEANSSTESTDTSSNVSSSTISDSYNTTTTNNIYNINGMPGGIPGLVLPEGLASIIPQASTPEAEVEQEPAKVEELATPEVKPTESDEVDGIDTQKPIQEMEKELEKELDPDQKKNLDDIKNKLSEYIDLWRYVLNAGLTVLEGQRKTIDLDKLLEEINTAINDVDKQEASSNVGAVGADAELDITETTGSSAGGVDTTGQSGRNFNLDVFKRMYKQARENEEESRREVSASEARSSEGVGEASFDTVDASTSVETGASAEEGEQDEDTKL